MVAPKGNKKSAFSCHACRQRKVKCGAEQPACKRCQDRGETCIYKLAPTLSYTERLEKRIRDLEEELGQLRVAYRQNDDVAESSSSAAAAAAASSSQQATAPVPEEDKHQAFSPSGPSVDSGTSEAAAFEGLRIDDQGVTTYHGITSFFQTSRAQLAHGSRSGSGAGAGVGFGAGTGTGIEGGGGDDAESGTAGSAGKAPQSSLSPEMEDRYDRSDRRERLVTNARQQRALETLSEIPEPFRYLLDLHWCWIQPLFNFIYRPAFTRDIEVMGHYYSHTLMNAVISHSIRWGREDPSTRIKLQEYDNGLLFGRQARSLVFDELNRGVCTIPTVQTLLLLSAQECGRGNSTQAWIYSGIAFRLVDHLGIFVDGQRYASNLQLSDEDIEIRRRLFWSCYLWDKIISLYLGRSPSLQHSTVSPPQVMLDDSSETETWTPHGVQFPQGEKYPPHQAHATSCFMHMCRLSVIFHQILIHIYDPVRRSSAAEIHACIVSQGQALNEWRDNLPSYLQLETAHLPAYAPPSHIVTLNSLYHTFRILLYRSSLTFKSEEGETTPVRDPSHLRECVSSAVQIIAIFDLFCRSFGWHHTILSMSYSVYTAASIFLLQVQADRNDAQALQRLEFSVACLERVKTIHKVIASAVIPIYEALDRLGIVLPTSPSNLQQERSQHQGSSTISAAAAASSSSPSSSSNFAAAVNSPSQQNYQPMTPPLSTPQPQQHHHHRDPTAQAIHQQFASSWQPNPNLDMSGMMNDDTSWEVPGGVFEAVASFEPISTRIRPLGSPPEG